MALTTGTIALIGAGIAAAGATGGAIGSAANRRKAREEESRSYNQARDYLTSQYYRDPLSTVGNRSLLKAAREAREDELEGLENRMVAGGATMENALAARKASNEREDALYGRLLQGEDQRRDAIDRQRLALDQQHSGFLQNGFVQAAQDWQNWGGQMAQAGMSVMSSGLLGDVAPAASGASAASDVAGGTGLVEKYAPIKSPKAITQGLGGLAGGVPWKNE